jgi:serine phosphatase RsbU (regulator of sigma subunit)
MIAGRSSGSPHSIGLDVSIWNSPAGNAKAGGDWCDAVQISDDELLLTVGDVSGHGEAVAGTMAGMRSSVLGSLHRARVPSEILAAANSTAVTDYANTIVTAIVAVFNQRLHTLAFANAGHPPPLLVSGDRFAFLEHPPADVPLGVFPRFVGANYVIALPRDAVMVFYTDGITEHDRDPIRGEAELSRAAQHAHRHADRDAASVIAAEIFSDGRGHDDAAVMALRIGRSRLDAPSEGTPSPTPGR